MTEHLHLDDERAQRYVDGALPEDEAGCCAEHVRCCDDCRLVVDSYRALADALEGLAAPAPDDGFTCCVMTRIDEVERVATRERRVVGAVLVAAALLLAGAVAVAGAGSLATTISGVATAISDGLHVASVGLDVASPLVRALRLQIVAFCVVLGLPLLLALRRLSVREAEAPAVAP